MKHAAFALPVSLLLLSCSGMVPEPTPVVSSFNEASVGIQLQGFALEMASPEVRAAAIAAADDQAAAICRQGPNRRSEFASTRNVPTGQYTYVIERLYLCLR